MGIKQREERKARDDRDEERELDESKERDTLKIYIPRTYHPSIILAAPLIRALYAVPPAICIETSVDAQTARDSQQIEQFLTGIACCTRCVLITVDRGQGQAES